MSELNEMRCDQFADVAAELALGVLTGRERAEAIAHLDGCEGCREHVRQLTVTGEGLLGLLSAREPPAGFETRVMDRLGMAAPQPRRLRWSRQPRWSRWSRQPRWGRTRRMLAVAAVTLTVAVSGLGGWGLRAVTAPSASSPPAGSLLSTASLVSASNQTVGKIFVYGGSPRWLFMSVDMGSGGTGTVTCELVGRDGHIVSLGKFRLNGGYGSWGSPPPLERGPFTGARLVSADGTVLATASFSLT
jgi:hypothetical protein